MLFYPLLRARLTSQQDIAQVVKKKKKLFLPPHFKGYEALSQEGFIPAVFCESSDLLVAPKHTVSQHAAVFQITPLKHSHGTYTEALKSFSKPLPCEHNKKRRYSLVTSAELSRASDYSFSTENEHW